MRAIGYLLFLSFLLVACQKDSKQILARHPLEHHLIPNVEIAAYPQRYSIPQRLEYHNISGLGLGILEKGKLAFAKGYGYANRNMSAPDSSTIFQVGSISKPVLGLISMILDDQGKISLDTLVTSYLGGWYFPENRFSANAHITLRHLLNHTAGLNRFNSWGMSPFEEPLPLAEVLRGSQYSQGISIDTIAGAKHLYSNYGYGVIQMALENQTGKSLETLSQELIFGPLGMENTSFQHMVPAEELSGYAFAYDEEGKVYEDYWKQALIPGSGGLKSTVKDLSLLLLTLLEVYEGKKLGWITPKMVQEIVGKPGYNLGFEVEGKGNELSITHTGRVKGFFAYMRIYPNTGQGLVMLCNSDNGGEIFKDILRGASDYYGWHIIKPKVIKPLPLSTDAQKEYVGEYQLTLENETYVAEISDNGAHLQFRMKDEEDVYPLRMVENHKFVDLIDGDDFEFIKKDSMINALILNQELLFIKIK